jgi:hypothetical protein
MYVHNEGVWLAALSGCSLLSVRKRNTGLTSVASMRSRFGATVDDAMLFRLVWRVERKVASLCRLQESYSEVGDDGYGAAVKLSAPMRTTAGDELCLNHRRMDWSWLEGDRPQNGTSPVSVCC